MLIDCNTCAMRDIACSDCVVTMLLGQPGAELDDDERRAVDVLADAGLIAPLRLVPLWIDPAQEAGQRRSTA